MAPDGVRGAVPLGGLRRPAIAPLAAAAVAAVPVAALGAADGGFVPRSGGWGTVEAVCGQDLHVLGGAVRNPGDRRHGPGLAPERRDRNGSSRLRGWYGLVVGGSGPFTVYAICAPAGATEFRSAGGQCGGRYGG